MAAGDGHSGIMGSRFDLIRGKYQRAERRQVQAYRVGMAMHRLRVGMNLACVTDAATAILHCVGVYALAIAPWLRHPYPIVLARDWGEVADDHRDFVRIPAAPQIGYDAFCRVRYVDPVESLGIAIQTVQGRRAAVEMIEIAHQTPNPLVQRFAQQLPVEPDIVVPLALLSELAAHEQQLLAGVGPHESEIGSQISETLPAIARHLADQRTLAMHHLVVAERQDEILVKGVEQPEAQVVVVVFAVDRIQRHIPQRVVHPPHVPFEAKAEPADISRARHHRPGGRLLGHRGRPRLPEHQLVHSAQKRDCIEVLAPAERVRDPLPRVAAVVEVEHRGDRIDPDAVDVEFAQPDRARSTTENSRPRGGRNYRSVCSSRGGNPAAGRRARKVPYHQSGRAHAGRSGNAREPNPKAIPAQRRGTHRQRHGNRPAYHNGWSARRVRSAGIPKSRRTDTR